MKEIVNMHGKVNYFVVEFNLYLIFLKYRQIQLWDQNKIGAGSFLHVYHSSPPNGIVHRSYNEEHIIIFYKSMINPI